MLTRRPTLTQREAFCKGAGAAHIAAALGNPAKSGKGWMCRCPVHDGVSLSIRDTDDGWLLWHCFAGCDGREVGRELHRLGLLPDRREVRAYSPTKPIPAPTPADPHRPRRMFERTGVPIRGTPVEHYLTTRCGPDVMLMDLGHVLRFWPATPPHFPWPAMVALVTDLLDPTKVLDLHFTDLLADGSGKAPIKPNKHTLRGHSPKGGVIRLVEDADIGRRIGFAEGIEKSLAIMTRYRRERGPFALPVWSGINAGVMGKLPVPPVIEQVVIFSDPNPAGRHAADELVERYSAADIEVFVGEPPNGCLDWDEVNDAAV
jgi:putative DNA primase/helicase